VAIGKEASSSSTIHIADTRFEGHVSGCLLRCRRRAGAAATVAQFDKVAAGEGVMNRIWQTYGIMLGMSLRLMPRVDNASAPIAAV